MTTVRDLYDRNHRRHLRGQVVDFRVAAERHAALRTQNYMADRYEQALEDVREAERRAKRVVLLLATVPVVLIVFLILALDYAVGRFL